MVMTQRSLEAINTKHVHNFQPLFIIKITRGAQDFGGQIGSSPVCFKKSQQWWQEESD